MTMTCVAGEGRVDRNLGGSYIGSDRQLVSAKIHSQRSVGVLLEFGSERACAPPALSVLNLGRLQCVVLPVKRDCSPDNPNSPGDYSSCVHEE